MRFTGFVNAMGPASAVLMVIGLSGCQGAGEAEADEQSVQAARAGLVPVLECVEQRTGETGPFWLAHFGYRNGGQNTSIPAGSDNQFQPAPAQRGQPTQFQKGDRSRVFSIRFDGKNLSWRLRGQTVSASSGSKGCPSDGSSAQGRDPGLQLPNDEAGTAVRGYLNAISNSTDPAVVSDALRRLRAVPATAMSSTLTTAFKSEPDPNLRWNIVQAGNAYRNPAMVPLFQLALAVELPPGFQEAIVDPHDTTLRAEASVLVRAVDGLVATSMDMRLHGSPAPWEALLAATRHTLRLVRSTAIFGGLRVGAKDHHLLALLRRHVLPADQDLLNTTFGGDSELRVIAPVDLDSDDSNQSMPARRR
jgi:hypothetical protein